jgi:pyrimidine operon attenuation protein/uracil phosphoribosyltransferase
MAADIQARNGDGELMVVSPDVGGVVRARALAKRLNNAPLAIVDKRRDKPGVSEVMNIIGDVKGRTCILIDDIIDLGGTLCNAAQALMDEGAASSPPTSPMACCRARRCRASPIRRSRNWSSPTRSCRPKKPRSRTRSAPDHRAADRRGDPPYCG